MSIKLDLHVHSESRGKTYIDSKGLRNSLIKNKLDGVAITNFFDISHAILLKKELQEFIILIGQEIWTKDGHIVGLGLRERIADFLSVKETIDCIHSQNGIAIAVHPYLFLGIGEILDSLPVDAIESYNGVIGSYIIPNYLARKIAKRKNISQIASTDTSDARFIGHSYTEIFIEDKNNILEAIKSGKVKLHKRALPVPFGFILKNIFNFRNIEPCSIHPVPCLICDRSMAVRIFKKKFKCIDCGKEQVSRIACSNDHYLCIECIIKRCISL